MSELTDTETAAVARFAQATLPPGGLLQAWFVDDLFIEGRRAWCLPPTTREIDEVWYLPGGTLPCYLLTEPGESFAILVTRHDYHIVAGPQEFVETVMGMELEGSRERVLRNFDDMLRDLLAWVWSHYD